MNVRLPSLVALICLLLLASCAESSNRCDNTDIPRLACGANAACVYADNGIVCLPTCETHEECADSELCYSRPVHTYNTELLSANVCYPSALGELPQTELDREELRKECRALGPEDCGSDPRCQREDASKLNLEAECTERMPVGCYALGTLCTMSLHLAEDSAGELFVFIAGCGNEAYTEANFALDDPLYQRLFEGQNSVYSWPRCN